MSPTSKAQLRSVALYVATLLASLVLAFALSGCGGGTEEPDTATPHTKCTNQGECR